MRCRECGSAALEPLAPGYLKCKFCGTPARDVAIELKEALTVKCFCGRAGTSGCTGCGVALCSLHDQPPAPSAPEFFTSYVQPGVVDVRMNADALHTARIPQDAAYYSAFSAELDLVKCRGCRDATARNVANYVDRLLQHLDDVESWIVLGQLNCLPVRGAEPPRTPAAWAIHRFLQTAREAGFPAGRFPQFLQTYLPATDAPGRFRFMQASYNPWFHTDRKVLETGEELEGYWFNVPGQQPSEFVVTFGNEVWSRRPPKVVKRPFAQAARRDALQLIPHMELTPRHQWFVAIGTVRRLRPDLWPLPVG